MGMENMGFAGGYLNAGQVIADTEGQRALTAERLQMMRQREFSMQQAAATREGMMAAAKGDSEGGMQSMDPSQLAASEGTDQPGSPKAGGGIAMGGMDQPKLSAIHRNEGMRAQRQADEIQKRGGDPLKIDAARKEAELAFGKATAAEKEERQENIQRNQSIRSLFGAIDGEGSFNDVILPQAEAEFGPQKVKQFLANLPLQKDPTTGRYLWNQPNIDIVKTITSAALTQEQREREKDRLADRERKQEDTDTRKAAEERRVRQEEFQEQNAQEGRQIQRGIQKRLEEEHKQKRGEAAEKMEQNNLYKDPIYKDFTKFENVNDLGKAIVTKLADPNTKYIEPSDARALATAYSNIAEGFRSQRGGKYALQDIDKFNGLAQKLNKWWQSFGGGTPALDRTTAQDMANTISQLNVIAHKNVAILSLGAMERIAAKGGNPDNINAKGDLDLLVRNGMATREDKGDKVIITIKGHKPFTFVKDKEE